MIEQFDVAIHLIGEQNGPNYSAIQIAELSAKRHILLATNKTNRVAQRLVRACPEITAEIQLVDAYDLQNLQTQITAIFTALEGCKIALNLTGGTKLMALALARCGEGRPQVTSFYIESGKILYNLSAGTSQSLGPLIHLIATFIKINSDNPLETSASQAPEMAEYRLAKQLFTDFKNAPDLLRYQRQFADLSKGSDKTSFFDTVEAFKRSAGGKATLLEDILSQYQDELVSGSISWKNAASFLAGGWFEIYTYCLLRDDKAFSKTCFDLQRNVRIASQDNVKARDLQSRDLQEFDVAYSDGFNLNIVECKSGDVTQEHIQKLENLVTRYGGTYGRGILCARKDQSQNASLLERIRNSKTIMLVDGAHVAKLPVAALNWKSGRFLG